jgi:hypothetical protein
MNSGTGYIQPDSMGLSKRNYCQVFGK